MQATPNWRTTVKLVRIILDAVHITFRDACYALLGALLLAGLILAWIWQPKRQVSRHAENLFREIESRDWEAVSNFIALDYHDQWNHDRDLLLTRLQDVVRYMRRVRIQAAPPNVETSGREGFWTARITMETDSNEVAVLVRERINNLTEPFELHWRKMSGKPWDWKLVRVSNPGLQVPESFE